MIQNAEPTAAGRAIAKLRRLCEAPLDPSALLINELRLLRLAIERTAVPAESVAPRDTDTLTLDEVAGELGVSKRQLVTLRSNDASPRLRTITLGKRGVRVTRRDLDDYIERKRQAAAIPPASKRRRR